MRVRVATATGRRGNQDAHTFTLDTTKPMSALKFLSMLVKGAPRETDEKPAVSNVKAYGLPAPGHYSTAFDLAKIMHHVAREPRLRDILNDFLRYAGRMQLDRRQADQAGRLQDAERPLDGRDDGPGGRRGHDAL